MILIKLIFCAHNYLILPALSGCGTSLSANCDLCPVYDHGWYDHPGGVELVGAIFTPDPDQNHPFTLAGCKSSLSNPLKSQSLPLVQM